MPNSNNAHYEEWKIWFERHFEYLRDGIILVGWSLGGMFLAKYLAENKPPFKIAKLYLLAGPSGEMPQQPDGNDCLSFKFSAESATHIAKKAENIEIWHSEDDFIVPFTEAYWYQKHLPGSKIRLFKDKNHFLVPELPELIADIKQSSQN
jgi:predicted alpha/beta hydrolase family esterase